MSDQAPQMTVLQPQEEQKFQQWITALPWYGQFQQRYGEAPNLNDPSYDYRAAFKQGITPQPYAPDGGAYHWPSVGQNGVELKAPNHPTAWMEDYMRVTGRDPHNPAPDLSSPQRQAISDALIRRYGKR